MTNQLYFDWLVAIAKRDQAMAFVVVTAMAAIGAWLALRDYQQARRVFVYTVVVLYYTSLILVAVVFSH